ncbi:hypothetical protein ACK3Y4_03060 [Aeromonas caviae]
MKTALLLIACWLLALIPLDQGLTPLVTLLFNPDRALYSSGTESHWLVLYAMALPFHLVGWLVFVRGIQAFGRQKG